MASTSHASNIEKIIDATDLADKQLPRKHEWFHHFSWPWKNQSRCNQHCQNPCMFSLDFYHSILFFSEWIAFRYIEEEDRLEIPTWCCPNCRSNLTHVRAIPTAMTVGVAPSGGLLTGAFHNVWAKLLSPVDPECTIMKWTGEDHHTVSIYHSKFYENVCFTKTFLWVWCTAMWQI